MSSVFSFTCGSPEVGGGDNLLGSHAKSMKGLLVVIYCITMLSDSADLPDVRRSDVEFRIEAAAPELLKQKTPRVALTVEPPAFRPVWRSGNENEQKVEPLALKAEGGGGGAP